MQIPYDFLEAFEAPMRTVLEPTEEKD